FGDGADFTMSVGPVNATLEIKAARLNGSTPVENQPVAGGASIPVTVAVDNTSIGNITLSPVTVVAGALSAVTEFHASAVGSAHITASSAGYGSSTVTVVTQTQSLICTDGLTIGKFLQDVGQV